MRQAEFEALVHRLEGDAARAEGAYTARVVALALLGYGWVFGVLLLLLTLVGGAALLVVKAPWFGIKLLFVLGPAAYGVARALFVRFPEPEGVPVTRAEAPALWARVDRLAATLGAPAIDAILFDDRLNAGIVQHPRLGVLGLHRNVLVLGAPLLSALPPEEFDAVLAHELGHLAGAHSRIGAWIYRTRATWARLSALMEAGAVDGRWLFRPFLGRYAPWFHAYSFVLARLNEFQADRASVEAAGAGAAGRALLRVNLAARHFDRLTEELLRKTQELGTAAPAPATHFVQTLHAAPRAEEAEAWLRDALQERSGLADTHPCLADRLGAIGAKPAVPPAATRSAWETLIGRAAPLLLERLNEGWAPKAAALQARLSALQAREAELRALAAPSPHETLELARLIEDGLVGDEASRRAAAIELLRPVATAAPEDAPVRFHLGRLLAIAEDPAGEAHLEAAARLDPEAARAVVPMLEQLRRRRGDLEGVRREQARLDALEEEDEAANEERAKLSSLHTFLPHGLPADEVAAIVRAAREVAPKTEALLLVRFALRHRPDRPVWLLFVEQEGIFAPAQELLQKIADAVPLGPLVVESRETRGRSGRRKLEAVMGAKIF